MMIIVEMRCHSPNRAHPAWNFCYLRANFDKLWPYLHWHSETVSKSTYYVHATARYHEEFSDFALLVAAHASWDSHLKLSRQSKKILAYLPRRHHNLLRIKRETELRERQNYIASVYPIDCKNMYIPVVGYIFIILSVVIARVMVDSPFIQNWECSMLIWMCCWQNCS